MKKFMNNSIKTFNFDNIENTLDFDYNAAINKTSKSKDNILLEKIEFQQYIIKNLLEKYKKSSLEIKELYNVVMSEHLNVSSNNEKIISSLIHTLEIVEHNNDILDSLIKSLNKK